MAPKNGPFLRIKAAAGLEKCPSQNSFNYIKPTMECLDNEPNKIWRFGLHRVWTDSFSEAITVKMACVSAEHGKKA